MRNEWVQFPLVALMESIKHFFQRLFRGWDDRETWNLDYEFYKWLYPRLKRFYEVSLTVPKNKTTEEWDLEIAVTIKTLELILKEDDYFDEKEKLEEAKFQINQWFIKNINNLHW